MMEFNDEDDGLDRRSEGGDGVGEDAAPDLLGEKRERERMSRQIAFGEGL